MQAKNHFIRHFKREKNFSLFLENKGYSPKSVRITLEGVSCFWKLRVRVFSNRKTGELSKEFEELEVRKRQHGYLGAKQQLEKL